MDGKELLGEMRQQVLLNLVSYGAALQVYGRSGGWKEALELLEEMSSARIKADAQARAFWRLRVY